MTTAVAPTPTYGTRPFLSLRRPQRVPGAAGAASRAGGERPAPDAAKEAAPDGGGDGGEQSAAQQPGEPAGADKGANDAAPAAPPPAQRQPASTRPEPRRGGRVLPERRVGRPEMPTSLPAFRRARGEAAAAAAATAAAAASAATAAQGAAAAAAAATETPAQAQTDAAGAGGEGGQAPPAKIDSPKASPTRRAGGGGGGRGGNSPSPARSPEKRDDGSPKRGEGEGAAPAGPATGGSRDPSPTAGAPAADGADGSAPRTPSGLPRRRMLSVRPEHQWAYERRMQLRRQQAQAPPSPPQAPPSPPPPPPPQAPQARRTSLLRAAGLRPTGAPTTPGATPVTPVRGRRSQPASPRRPGPPGGRARPSPPTGDADVRPPTDSTHNSDLVELWVREAAAARGSDDSTGSRSGGHQRRRRDTTVKTVAGKNRGTEYGRGRRRGERPHAARRDAKQDNVSEEEEVTDTKHLRNRGRQYVQDPRQFARQSKNQRRPSRLESFVEEEEEEMKNSSSILSARTSEFMTNDEGLSGYKHNSNDSESENSCRTSSVLSRHSSREVSPDSPHRRHYHHRHHHHHHHRDQKGKQGAPERHRHHHRHHRHHHHQQQQQQQQQQLLQQKQLHQQQLQLHRKQLQQQQKQARLSSPPRSVLSPSPSRCGRCRAVSPTPSPSLSPMPSPTHSVKEQHDVDHMYLEGSVFSVKPVKNATRSHKTKKRRRKEVPPDMMTLLKLLHKEGASNVDVRKLGLKLQGMDVNAMGEPHAGVPMGTKGERPSKSARKSPAGIIASAQALIEQQAMQSATMSTRGKSGRRASLRAGSRPTEKTRATSARASPTAVPVPWELLPPQRSPQQQQRSPQRSPMARRRTQLAGVQSSPLTGAPGGLPVSAVPYLQPLGVSDPTISGRKAPGLRRATRSAPMSVRGAACAAPGGAVGGMGSRARLGRRLATRGTFQVAFTRTTTTCGLLQRVGPRTTARQLRRAFAELWGVPLQCLAIYFAGRRLPDAAALWEAGVRANDVLDVFMTPPPAQDLQQQQPPAPPSALASLGGRRHAGPAGFAPPCVGPKPPPAPAPARRATPANAT